MRNTPIVSDKLVLSESKVLRCTVFFYLYLMQGVPAGFALTAIANYLIAQGQSAQEVGKFVAMVSLPWTLQFFWGPFSDSFQQSPLGQRRPWVLISQLLSCMASLPLLFIESPVEQIELLTFSFFAHSMFASLQDASVDAMAISVTPAEERGRINAFMRGGMLIGTSLGAAVMALVIHNFGFFEAAFLQSAFLFVFTLFTFFIREKKTDALLWQSLRRQETSVESIPEQKLGNVFLQLFKAIFSRASLPIFAVIACVYTCLSIFIRAFNVHLIQQLHWTDTYLSTLSGSYVLAGSIVIILASGFLADKIGAGKMLLVIMLIISAYLLIFNALAPLWRNTTLSSAGLLIYYLFDPSFSVAAMPMLMFICRKGIEGSQFTTYMSLVNFCDVAGAYLSGYALLWLSAPVIGLLCGFAIIGALLCLYLLQRSSTLTFKNG